MAFPLPEKPSIVVLPFVDLSIEGNGEALAEGISEDILTALSKFSALFVISRTTSFTYKGPDVTVKQVAEDLGVSYVLEGSVQRAGGESFRVTAQLIDALNGNHVWAESYDRELADIFAVKDEITLNIVANIGAVTEVGERDRAVRNETESLDAWLLWREGRSKLALFQQEENHLARQNFLAALEIDPDFKSAMTEFGNTYRSDAMFFWCDFDVAIEEAFKYYGQVLGGCPGRC